ncbi:hypothetical protein [Streptomyces sp. NPDC058401]|uniref:hypothetical protein n=1 Tax=Streptomyces sp. NPDC058401 TaxID=3346480 RepID=UPI00365B66F2
MHTGKAKKGDLPPALLGEFRRRVNRSSAAPLKGLFGHKGGAVQPTVVYTIVDKIGDQTLVLNLDGNRTASLEVKSTRGGAAGSPLKKPKAKQGRAKLKKPLIDLLKAPMTRAEAKKLSESLRAEDGPRRKLPPRP